MVANFDGEGVLAMERRKPNNTYAVRAQSLPEIGMLLEQEAARMIGKIRFRGGKVKAGPLIVAYVIHCLRQPVEVREKIARENLGLYEQLMELDRPIGTPDDLNGMSKPKETHGKRAAIAGREREMA